MVPDLIIPIPPMAKKSTSRSNTNILLFELPRVFGVQRLGVYRLLGVSFLFRDEGYGIRIVLHGSSLV